MATFLTELNRARVLAGMEPLNEAESKKLKTNKLLGSVEMFSDVAKLKHAAGEVNIDITCVGYHTPDKEVVQETTKAIRKAAKDVGATVTGDFDYKVTGIPADKLDKFFAVIKNVFNAGGVDFEDEECGWKFTCYSESYSLKEAQVKLSDAAWVIIIHDGHLVGQDAKPTKCSNDSDACKKLLAIFKKQLKEAGHEEAVAGFAKGLAKFNSATDPKKLLAMLIKDVEFWDGYGVDILTGAEYKAELKQYKEDGYNG